MKYYKYETVLKKIEVHEAQGPRYTAKKSSELVTYLVEVCGLDCELQEHFVVVLLNTKLGITGHQVVGIGGVDSAPASPADVLRPAILAGAAAIAIAHNHPSGDPTPSKADVEITNRIKEAAKIMNIKLLDHIIVGHDNHIVSFAENNMI